MKILYKGTTAYMIGDKFAVLDNLSDNTWAQIKARINNGTANAKWLGQTKAVTLTNNRTLTFKCVDNTYGRYQFADGTYSTLVFMAMGSVPDILNAISVSASATSKTYNEASQIGICNNSFLNYNCNDNDLKSVLKETNVKCAGYTQEGYADYDNLLEATGKIFNPSVAEVKGLGSGYSAYKETESALDSTLLGNYTGLTSVPTIAHRYYTRTLATYSSNLWYAVETSGSLSTIAGTTSVTGLCLAFAL